MHHIQTSSHIHPTSYQVDTEGCFVGSKVARVSVQGLHVMSMLS